MKRDRKILSLLLGLVILVQGVAVSAAPFSMLHESPPVTMASDRDADMPCHGQKSDSAVDANAPGGDSQSCCDSDCPNMGSCMLGHLAINANFQLTTPHSPDAVPHLITVRVVAQTLPSLLRPPISLHG